jgi:hypothetical protein
VARGALDCGKASTAVIATAGACAAESVGALVTTFATWVMRFCGAALATAGWGAHASAATRAGRTMRAAERTMRCAGEEEKGIVVEFMVLRGSWGTRSFPVRDEGYEQVWCQA